MADTTLPAYVQVHRRAGGEEAFFWVRPAWANPKLARHPDEKVRRRAVRAGRTCPVESTALGTKKGDAINRAEALNETFREWRAGAEGKVVHGSVRWLFAWYREQDKFTAKRHKTRKGYAEAMEGVCEIGMKVGVFGTRLASAIDGPTADTLYKRAREKHGERQAAYMMQVCRLVWNHASRPGYAKATTVKANPFAGMGIKASSGTGRGNRSATRAEYNLYRETARALGLQSMATAAALCFEGCQRVWDVFGFEDPDKRVARGIFWSDYRPGEQISLVQSKTGKQVTLPLVDRIDGEDVQLYPELEDELARTPAGDGMIVRRELDGRPYPIDFMPKMHRKIRDKAGLPRDLRFTSFRHGGLTEIGDADVVDMRAVSGHTKVETTTIYNKANVEKARKIAAKRREHVALIEAESDAKKEAA